jgi:hypothetical protein
VRRSSPRSPWPRSPSRGALADDLSLTAEPSFSHVETDVTDQAGVKTSQVSDVLRQRYGLTLDRRITDFVAASAGGTLVDDQGWRRTSGVSSDTHARSTALFGRLSLGTPVLNAGLGVDRRVQEVLSSPSPAFVTRATPPTHRGGRSISPSCSFGCPA